MAKPMDLTIGDWNDAVGLFHAESDRGAAVLAGGFVESTLGNFLKARMAVPELAAELLGAMGPLSSFAQRSSIAYAFGFINKTRYDDLNAIRRIRNHFAHHPLDATFGDESVIALAGKLSLGNDEHPVSDGRAARSAYLITCGFYAANMLIAIKEIERKKATG